jgi:hypothetical protein
VSATPQKKEPPHPVSATPDPHHDATGNWSCYSCKRPLKGTFLRPVIPWEHKADPPPKSEDLVSMPGLATTE